MDHGLPWVITLGIMSGGKLGEDLSSSGISGSAARIADMRSDVKVAIPQRRGRLEETNAILMV